MFPNKSLRRLKECVAIRDRLLTNKLQEHKVTPPRPIPLPPPPHSTRRRLTCVQAALDDGDPRDLLEALLKGQEARGQRSPGAESITDDHVLMTAAEAFGAGVETTSTTLLWIVAYLLHHPEVALFHWSSAVTEERLVWVQRPECVAGAAARAEGAG